jgi:thiol-disulfide isomerase/thioredoxin
MALPGCETNAEVRKVLDEKLASKLLYKMKFTERAALERRVLEDLIAKYPRELEPYRTLGNTIRSETPDEFPLFRDRLVKMSKDNPDDPLALMLAGWALRGKDTLEAIRLLEVSKAKAPNFPWAARELAAVYFSGKRVDQNKVKENIEIFFALCSASTDRGAQFVLDKDPSLQPKVAVALRACLQTETDPKRLQDYETLWGLEFRTRRPQEHDALRAQVADDLKRLDKLNPEGSSEWQAFLITGYKQSGASKDTITAKEDRLIRGYPHSNEALEIVRQRWEETHQEPSDPADTVAWDKYQREHEQALKVWIRDYPDDAHLQQFDWFYAILNDYALSEADGIAALDTFLQNVRDFSPPGNRTWAYFNAGQFLNERGWQPGRALEFSQQARQSSVPDLARLMDDDNLSGDDAKDRKETKIFEQQYFDGLTLRAANLAGRPEEALKLKSSVEMPPPAEKKLRSGYWLNRARLEAIQNHTQDALAYYQLALQTRVIPPQARHGRLRDDLNDEAHALWKQQGGTDAAWVVWSKPVEGAEQLAEGRWEKAMKPIPSFELSDLSGKTWRLKDLAGKKVFINVWATWCGPCQGELPHLQKFYEKVKDRSDIQVLTFNLDEDLGLVAPYMKEKGYTFPVLPAVSTVVTLLDGFAIPQNWLIDPEGVWRWKQIGYGGVIDADFERDMLARLGTMSTNLVPER